MNIVKSLPRIIPHTSSKATILFNTISPRTYAFKSDLKIKWVRPEKIPCYKPAKSGDVEPMPKIDLNQYSIEFRNCKQLEDADEIVRKLFTLEFAPHIKTVQSYIKDVTDSVQRHEFDGGSMESKIARWTAAIRVMQDIMEEYPRNKIMKVKLKELIEKRKMHLKYLRRRDYKKFEWLLDTLNIVYKPDPTGEKKVTRKGSLRKLTDKYCEDTKQNKLDEFKQILQEQQPVFLEEKIRSLEFIRSEQESCGVKVTISEEEISEVKQQLTDLLKERTVSVSED